MEWNILTGTISALSTVANANLLSTIRISISEWQSYIGKSALISFFPKNNIKWEETLTLPLDAVSIIAEWEWEISIYTGTGIFRKTVKIWKTFGDTVEILDTMNNGTEIILTNTSNYDASKQNIEKKTQD